MLRLETEFTYERRQGDTVFVIESVSAPEGSADMLDALVELMKRDIEELGKR